MDIRPECVPCLMKRVLFQAKLADNGTEFNAVSLAMATYSKEFAEGKNSASIATKVHSSAYSAMGVIDPYYDMKVRADEVASEYIEFANDLVKKSDDKLKTAVLVACIGNIMDFGSGIAIDDPDDFRNEFQRLLDQGIGSDDTEELRNILNGSKQIIYMFDNCGESQLDKILIDVIRKMGVKVIGIVRGKPILNDVTMEDALRIGLNEHLDEIMTTGQFAIGMNVYDAGQDVKDAISSSDLMIAKGMANYESLSDQSIGIPITYILRTKCVPVAESLGVDTDINVVRVITDRW